MMSRLDAGPLPLLHFSRTAEYACSYLENRRATSLVATPPEVVTTAVYAALVRVGFRRSGSFAYRPDCEGCRACVPVRVPVERFAPNRSQRRSLKTHDALHARELPALYFDAHYELYRRYQSARHPGGGMDEDDRDQYANFLLQSRVDSRLIEFTENGVLRMVSLIDVLDDGLSSVYTFYDPDSPGASFGTYGILWQIAQCQANRLPYLYLGYWIGQSRKMDYKARFRPIEALTDGEWREFSPLGDSE